MHCRIPLVNLSLNTWINLSIDVISFASECFKSQTFRSIEFISITGNCKVKKIFSMRNLLVNSVVETNAKEVDQQNKIIGFPPKLSYENININIDKVRKYIDNDIVNKCSQIITKNQQGIPNNNYTNPLTKNNNIIVITNKNTNQTERINQQKKSSKYNGNSGSKRMKNVVFVSRREINELGKSPIERRSRSNNPYGILNKNVYKSKEHSSEMTKLQIDNDNNLKELENNIIEINILDNENNISIKKNNFTLEGSIKSNKSISKKGHSLERSNRNINLNSPHYGKSRKETEMEESIEELYEHDYYSDNNNETEKDNDNENNVLITGNNKFNDTNKKNHFNSNMINQDQDQSTYLNH
jgi:hypothetical protein